MDYLSFCTSVRFNLSWNSLKYKYEYLIESDEFSLYQLLADETYLLALNLGLEYKLCEALSYVHGFVFCNYGYAGWEAIKEFFKIKEIETNLETVKMKILKAKISRINNLADETFYGYVEELFSDEIKTKEVKLVAECYRIIKSLQPIKNESIKEYHQLVATAINEMKEQWTLGIFDLNIEKFIPKDTLKFVFELPEALKNEYHIMMEEEWEDIQMNHPDYSMDQRIYSLVERMINN